MAAPQTFQNHARYVPLYHYVTSPLTVVLVVWSAVELVGAPSADRAFLFLLALAVGLAAFWARAFATRVQDRVIRLEERLRMERLFSDALLGRIGDFTVDQLVALRFASDAELEELAGRVLEEGLADRKTIKSMVKGWRADHVRV